MKKINALFLTFLATLGLVGCQNTDEKTITVAASEVPHAQILTNAVKPLVEEKGYTLEVKVLDWQLQNDAVKNGDYDANYFQHRPYLQQYNSNYEYVEPIVTVHFEPLRIYNGKASVSLTDPTATFEICNDTSNEIRALDLLKENGIIDSYELDDNGNPINLPSRITPIEEDLLAASLSDYDYAVLPANTALTANLEADTTLPVESEEVADLRANVLAANTEKYASDEAYKAKIDVLADALLDSSVADYINEAWNNVIEPYQVDLRK